MKKTMLTPTVGNSDHATASQKFSMLLSYAPAAASTPRPQSGIDVQHVHSRSIRRRRPLGTATLAA
jgi:hypothetical protein